MASVFFGSLPDDVRSSLIDQSRVVTLSPGQHLFHKGEVANAVFAVVDGLIKLTIERRDGQEILVETFHSGTSFAEALAFGDGVYPVTASAIVQSRVLVAPKPVVQRELHSNPQAVHSLLSATYRHLHGLVRQIEELKGNSALERLAHYILAKFHEGDSVTEIEIPFDKKVLASLLGLKPETLSRAFKRLADHGVSTEKRVIRLQDATALRAFLDQ